MAMPGEPPGYMSGDPAFMKAPVVTQPQSSTAQNVVVVNAAPAVHIIPPGQWTTGLCGCFEDCGSCLASFCCHNFYRCYLANKLDESCCYPICVPGAATDLMVLRMKIRTMNNIPGNAMNDCCAASCCPYCVAAQLSREWDNTIGRRHY
ncbi:placenta-specific gene 8 protein-like [Ptychodera flava]|uniref:placenta-specific gene 8 protein-like n=1 Tax=Ptychodera flava TaxID=63121 RepID=UPI00396AA7A7